MVATQWDYKVNTLLYIGGNFVNLLSNMVHYCLVCLCLVMHEQPLWMFILLLYLWDFKMQSHFKHLCFVHFNKNKEQNTDLWILICGFVERKDQPDLIAICTYFTRWLIRTNSYNLTRTNSYDFCQIVHILRVTQFVWICTNYLHLTPPLNLPFTGI